LEGTPNRKRLFKPQAQNSLWENQEQLPFKKLPKKSNPRLPKNQKKGGKSPEKGQENSAIPVRRPAANQKSESNSSYT